MEIIKSSSIKLFSCSSNNSVRIENNSPDAPTTVLKLESCCFIKDSYFQYIPSALPSTELQEFLMILFSPATPPTPGSE